MVRLRLNGEMVEADKDTLYRAIEELGSADEGGIEIISAHHKVREKLERLIEEKTDDDEEVWQLI